MNTAWVLITGATSGVGLNTADLLHSLGYKVIGTSSKETLGSTYPIVQMDMSSSSQRQNAWDQLLKQHGPPSTMILNAGIGEIAATEEASLEHARNMMEINYFGPLWLLQQITPHWRQQQKGHCIAIGSIVFDVALPFKGQYNASKSAFSSHFLTYAKEVKQFGIYTSLLEPGWIRSNFHNKLKPIADTNSPYSHQFKKCLDHSKDENKKYPDGKSIAKIILNQLQKPKFCHRVTVGPDAKAARFLNRFLPINWSEKLMIRFSGL